MCTVYRLGYGEPGGDKVSCGKHVRSLGENYVSLSAFCAYVGCREKATFRVKNTRYNFCIKHVSQLVNEGLIKSSIINMKKTREICSYEGCFIVKKDDVFCAHHDHDDGKLSLIHI